MSIGESVPMLDSRERVTGKVPYMANLPAGMLHEGAAPSAHARITRLDASAAETMPGVVAVLTAADFDAPGAPELFYGFRQRDQPVVARDKVRYVGEPVALIAAESPQQAEDALYAFEIDYEELPAVYDPVEAMQPGAPQLHDATPENRMVHAKLRHGDVEAGFAEADLVIEETFTSPLAQQASLEPHITIAQWQDGRLTVWSGAQAPYGIRNNLAELFHVERPQVRVIVPPLGGAYGGKGHIRIEPMVAALAWKVGERPVRLALSRAEEFVTVTKHAATVIIKTGVRSDGTLTARQVTTYWGGGAYADASPGLVAAGMVRSVGPYRIPNVRIDSYGVYTNLPPAAAYRGAMSSQSAWAYESHMDTIARRLWRDPLDLRLQNLLISGDHFATGEEMHDVHFVECLDASARELGWEQPLDRGSGPIRRGRGCAVMMKSTVATSRSEARLEIDPQGSVTLFTSTVEMGQGAHTALAQVAADSVGVPVGSVRVVGPDTAVTPFDPTTSASRSTNMMGTAILNTGAALKHKLVEAAGPLLEEPTDHLSAADGAVFVTANSGERITYADILRRSDAEARRRGSSVRRARLDPKPGGIATPHWHQGAMRSRKSTLKRAR
jgi:CO/xanthine dehydrogenase Mo-binding subunit